MARDDLLEHVPPIARYRRVPLDPEQNALSAWEQAAEAMISLDDAPLDDGLLHADRQTGRLAPFPTGAEAARVRGFVEDNRKTIELLHAGVCCPGLQFPAPDDEDESPEAGESIRPLAELGHVWFVAARARMADRDPSAAASELIGLGEMGHRICCGEGLEIHYLMGGPIQALALQGMRLLAAEGDAPPDVLARLAEAVRRWLTTGDVGQCLRVELCEHSLAEIERLDDNDPLERLVGGFLDRCGMNAPLPSSDADANGHPTDDDGRLAWRRAQILRVLEGHPSPFDKVATAVLVGREVAARILELRAPRRFDLVGQARRLGRLYWRARFRYRAKLWPGQLHPSFPYDCLGPGRAAQDKLAELQSWLKPSEWSDVQPPSDARIEAVRRRFRDVPNPFGLLVAETLLGTDVTRLEPLRRRRLRRAEAALAAALKSRRRSGAG